VDGISHPTEVETGDIVVLQHFPANILPQESIVNVTGAVDTLVAPVLASLVQNPRGFEDPESLRKIMEDAQAAAALTLKSEFAVSISLFVVPDDLDYSE